jgi:hypothetical protein
MDRQGFEPQPQQQQFDQASRAAALTAPAQGQQHQQHQLHEQQHQQQDSQQQGAGAAGKAGCTHASFETSRPLVAPLSHLSDVELAARSWRSWMKMQEAARAAGNVDGAVRLQPFVDSGQCRIRISLPWDAPCFSLFVPRMGAHMHVQRATHSPAPYLHHSAWTQPICICPGKRNCLGVRPRQPYLRSVQMN